MQFSVGVFVSVSVKIDMSVSQSMSAPASALPRLQYGPLASLPQWGQVRQEDQTEAVGPSVQAQAQGHHRAPPHPQHQALGQDED